MLLEFLEEFLDEDSWQELEAKLSAPITQEDVTAFLNTRRMNGWNISRHEKEAREMGFNV